jgi:hypothetical protein
MFSEDGWQEDLPIPPSDFAFGLALSFHWLSAVP